MSETATGLKITLSQSAYNALQEQVKESLGNDIRVTDEVFRQDGTWCVDVYHEIVIGQEENEEKSIKSFKLGEEGKYVPFREKKETVSLTIPSIIEFEWLVDDAERVEDLPNPITVDEEDRETAQQLYDKRVRELAQYKVLAADEDHPNETPYLLELLDGRGTLIVLEKKEICRDCGRCTIVNRMSYVWKGTKDPDLLKLGYGSSVKHYYTECSFCSYGMYG